MLLWVSGAVMAAFFDCCQRVRERGYRRVSDFGYRKSKWAKAAHPGGKLPKMARGMRVPP